MASTNDITGDSIQTGTVTDEYRTGHETIFGVKPPRVPYVYVPPTLQEVEDSQAEDEEFKRIAKEFDDKVVMKEEYYDLDSE